MGSNEGLSVGVRVGSEVLYRVGGMDGCVVCVVGVRLGMDEGVGVDRDGVIEGAVVGGVEGR